MGLSPVVDAYHTVAMREAQGESSWRLGKAHGYIDLLLIGRDFEAEANASFKLLLEAYSQIAFTADHAYLNPPKRPTEEILRDMKAFIDTLAARRQKRVNSVAGRLKTDEEKERFKEALKA